MPGHAVLVHGLWHGAWAWDAVLERLGPGFPAVAIDLPLTSFAEDVTALQALLDTLAGPVALLGHSYGGAVITAAGEHRAVRELVYLAAFALAEGESISAVLPDAGIAPTRLGDALRFSADGTRVGLDPVLGRQLLYGQAGDAAAEGALSRLRPVSRSLFGARAGTPAWRTRPATYVVCGDDRCVAPELQRAMARRLSAANRTNGPSARTLEWNSDHSPATSHPDLVADLIRASVDALCR